jgi:hypothetical protein
MRFPVRVTPLGGGETLAADGVVIQRTAGSSVVVSIHAGMHAYWPSGEHQQRSRLTVAAR